MIDIKQEQEEQPRQIIYERVETKRHMKNRQTQNKTQFKHMTPKYWEHKQDTLKENPKSENKTENPQTLTLPIQTQSFLDPSVPKP